jgi:protein tyrosine phosphatase (PTP) superfamily phosphohydrolase (DUF442 family)
VLIVVPGIFGAQHETPDRPEVLNSKFPAMKTWWAKKIDNEVFTGGRPTERAIKYLGEQGYKSIISVYNFDEDAMFGTYLQPKTTTEKMLAEESGMDFHLMDPVAGWPPVEDDVARLQTLLEAAKKPVYVHCGTGLVATLLSSLNRYNFDKDRVLAIEEQFQFGWFGNEAISSMLKKVLKLETVPSPKPTPGFDRSKFWWAKRLTDHFDVAGQVMLGNIPLIKAAGYKAVINFRKTHPKHNGNPVAQEETTLLNVRHFGTQKEGKNYRQIAENLEADRVFPGAKNSYVDIENRTGSGINYEMTNPQEFGDDIGYNEHIERKAFEEAGIKYYNLPIGGNSDYTSEWFQKNAAEVMKEVVDNGQIPALLHCRTAYRATFGGMVFHAMVTKDIGAAKAIEMANIVGYGFPKDDDKSAHWTRFGKVLYEVSDGSPPDAPPSTDEVKPEAPPSTDEVKPEAETQTKPEEKLTPDISAATSTVASLSAFFSAAAVWMFM